MNSNYWDKKGVNKKVSQMSNFNILFTSPNFIRLLKQTKKNEHMISSLKRVSSNVYHEDVLSINKPNLIDINKIHVDNT